LHLSLLWDEDLTLFIVLGSSAPQLPSIFAVAPRKEKTHLRYLHFVYRLLG